MINATRGPRGRKQCEDMARKSNAAEKLETPKNKVDHATAEGETITIREAIDDPQIVRMKRDEIVSCDARISEIETKKREQGAKLALQIKELKQRKRELHKEVQTGTQAVEVEVIEIPNQRLGTVILARRDTGTMINERPMSESERKKQIDWVADLEAAEAKSRAQAEEEKKAADKAKAEAEKSEAANDADGLSKKERAFVEKASGGGQVKVTGKGKKSKKEIEDSEGPLF